MLISAVFNQQQVKIKEENFIEQIKKWSVMQDSNLRPSAPKADALPDCANHRRSAFYRKLYVMSRKNYILVKLISKYSYADSDLQKNIASVCNLRDE